MRRNACSHCADAVKRLAHGECTVIYIHLHRPQVDYVYRPSCTSVLPNNSARKLPVQDVDLARVDTIQRALRALIPADYATHVNLRLVTLALHSGGGLMVVLLNAASTALACSDIPYTGPAAAVAVSLLDGGWEAGVEVVTRAASNILLVATERGVTLLDVQARRLPLLMEA